MFTRKVRSRVSNKLEVQQKGQELSEILTQDKASAFQTRSCWKKIKEEKFLSSLSRKDNQGDNWIVAHRRSKDNKNCWKYVKEEEQQKYPPRLLNPENIKSTDESSGQQMQNIKVPAEEMLTITYLRLHLKSRQQNIARASELTQKKNQNRKPEKIMFNTS